MNRHLRALLILAVPVAIVAGVVLGANALYGDKSIATFGGGSNISNLNFSRDGTKILCGREMDVDVYSFAAKKLTLSLVQSGSQAAYAYESADGNSVFGLWKATAQTDGDILDEWDIRTGKAQTALKVENAYSYFFSNDGKYVAVSTLDGQGEKSKQIEVWNVEEKTKIASFAGTSTIENAAFSANDTEVAASESTGGKIEIFDTASGKRTTSFFIPSPLKNPAPGLVYTSDRRYLLAHINANLDYANSSGHSGETEIFVYDAKTYKLVRKISLFKFLNVSPDGKYVIGMNKNGAGNDVLDMVTHNRGLNVVELATGKVVMQGIQGHKGGIAAAAFSSNMNYIVTGGEEGDLKLWKFDPNS